MSEAAIQTTSRTHQPWCRDHYTEDDFPEQPGWCHHTFLLERRGDGMQRMSVNIQPRMHDSSDAGIDVYTDDDKISPDEARRLAAALVRAADVLDGSGGRLGARIVRVPGLGRDGVWLEDYGFLLVDSTLTPGEARGLLAEVAP